MNLDQERLLWLLTYGPGAKAGSSPDIPGELNSWTREMWDTVVTEAERHGLAPMLHHRLARRFPAAPVPAPVRERLKRAHRACAAKNLGRFHALAPVLAGFSKAGIAVIVLKGAYLAATVYENFALREMSDVDLLVRREDLPGADAILEGAGFLRKEFSAAPASDLKEFHYQDRAGRTMVDIHWELYRPDCPFRFDQDDMWRAAVPAVVAGVGVRAFAPEDQLIHLASHAAIHRFEFGLRPLCDLAEVIARQRVEWPLLVEKARRQKAGRAVGVPLLLARNLLGVEIPAAASEGLGVAELPERLFSEAQETVLLNARGKRSQGEPNPNLLFFLGRRRWRDRLVLVRNRLFPSRQTVATIYPVAADSPRVWFYYPRYSWRIVARNLPGLKTVLQRKARRIADRDASAELMDWMLG